MCFIKDSNLIPDTLLGEDGSKNVDQENKTAFVSSTRSPNAREIAEELVLLGRIVWPIILTSLLLYSRSIISMLFLGHLGDAELAGGSLAIAFANITGYSVLKGLAMGMEPICGQAFGAKRSGVLAHTFQRTLLLLLLFTVPISLVWFNIENILLRLRQDPEITAMAREYILCSIPDLVAQACFHPLRIFLRTQGLTKVVTACATFSILLHVPVNYILVSYLRYGVRGVALASAWNSVTINLALLAFLLFSNKALKPWAGLSSECLHGWRPLVAFAAPSAASVCLEWWWYEVMLLLCGLLPDAKSSVAAMGVLIQTTALIYVLPSSIGMGLSTRVSLELGARQPGRARRATIVGLAVASACGLLAFLFATSFRGTWGRMFTDDRRILELTSVALPIVGFSELGNCPQTVGFGVLRGSARPAVGANINFSSFYLIGLPVAAIAGFWLRVGFVGLWLGLVAAQATCVFLMLYTVLRTDWEVQVQRAELLLLTGEAAKVNDDMEARLLG